MYNRCPHFNEGILPIFPIKSTTSTTTTNELFHGGAIIKLSIYFIISLLILLPRKSLAAGLQYETAYACEGKTLTISCDPGYLISLIRANYGRFSITICNDHGNVEWSVNCMSPKSLRVLHSKCTHKQNCSVLASTNMFGDPCPGTHKYLEAHYQCISAAQTSTTTTRPSPPWLITNSPNIWSTSTIPATVTSSMKSTSGHQTPTTARIGSIHQMVLPQKPPPQSKGAETPGTSQGSGGPSTGSVGTSQTNIHLAGGRPPIVDPFDTRGSASRPTNTPFSNRGGVLQSSRTSVNSSSPAGEASENGADSGTFNRTQSTPSDDAGRHESQDQSKHTNRNEDNSIYNQQTLTTQSPSVLVNNNNNNYDGSIDSGYYCGPTTMRNLFWNVTRVGEVNVQPCPGGAFGIAKWRCVLQQIASSSNRSDVQMILSDCASRSCETQHQLSSSRNSPHRAVWHPLTPDLTQCRSVWINNLEISVNQRDSSLISIANDLSQITSSKTLYGGDMLVTTKIIQTMSEKMAYDIETFPDQKQREAIITELLSGVVKTGSNLLDISHKHTWLDLSFEDQMRVATSLLTGLEDNAFLLADSIIRERTVVQKVKNILLSIRVLETRNIVGNEVFPDGKVEQWDVSEDRIELPRGALVENSEAGLVRIVFVAFDRLETILKPWLNHLDVKFTKGEMQRNHSKNTAGIQQNRILNSKVISASLGKGRHIQLSQPIRLILRHLKVENVTNPVCVFWNYIDHAWSEDGCYLEHTNHSHTICMCNHLTNFAILMDTTDDTAPSLLSLFNNNIRILIYISIAICIIFIIVAILTLKLFNGIFVKSSRSSVYKNIYVCLFIIEILFLFGIEQSETNVLCGFTTAFLHCFVLSAIAWLFFEGFQLYLTLTTDDMFIEVENSSKLIWYYLLSYGLSFTIVAISLAIDPGTYTQSDFCVLMEPNALFYTTFLAPVVIFVMGANSYSILSAYIMCKKSKTTLKNKEHSRLSSIRFDLRCSFLFLTILLADWVFAYLYLRKAKFEESVSLFYGYIFIACNSIMGVYIFIFHCIQNEKIRHEYRKYIRQNSWLPKCLRCSKVSISSSASQHQQHYGTTTSKKSPIAAVPSAHSVSNPSIVPSSSAPYLSEDQDLAAHSCTIVDSVTKVSAADLRQNIFLDQATGGGTLRGFSGSAIASGGHISPASSAGSTHLIFNSTQNDHSQDWSFQLSKPGQPQHFPSHSGNADFSARNLNIYDAKYLNYDCKSNRAKQHPMGGNTMRSCHTSSAEHAPQHHHEYFYWGENNPSPKKQRINGELKATSQKSDNVHSFYPSYKKTPRHYPMPPGGDHDKLKNDCDFPDTDPRLYHYPSDDDRTESHVVLPRPNVKGFGSDNGFDGFSTSYRPQQQRYRQKYLGGGDFAETMPLPAVPNQDLTSCPPNNAASSSYYSRSPTAGMDEPVYEEILSNRASDFHEDSDGDEEDDDDEGLDDRDDGGRMGKEEHYNRMRRLLASKEDSGLGGMEPLRQSFNRYHMKQSEFDYPVQSAKATATATTSATTATTTATDASTAATTNCW
ncbi:unnamed protein product [Hermetia illucens]|uniref:Latrophilin Cirl n=1 Tax=Hermetia illucens TaxID=343691 RepID=A0A7R8Z5F9_HERIL|nr:latrophilin Cirl-like isoform X3 [Hermetia illucens]CAD7094067.1 unnamed protein product [Hermetia illucens]